MSNLIARILPHADKTAILRYNWANKELAYFRAQFKSIVDCPVQENIIRLFLMQKLKFHKTSRKPLRVKIGRKGQKFILSSRLVGGRGMRPIYNISAGKNQTRPDPTRPGLTIQLAYYGTDFNDGPVELI